MNLAKLGLAVERFAQGQSAIAVQEMQCIRARDKSAGCDRCVQACPVNAISLEGGVHLDAESCIRCGLCLHVCSTSVFSGKDDVSRLLYCVSQLVDHETIEIACALHPEPSMGDPKVDAVITTTGCLAALGASAYVSLASHGVRSVRARVDACGECALAQVQPGIVTEIRQANDLLELLDSRRSVVTADPAVRPKQRAVYSVKNPPVSRRGLFQALGQGGRDLLPPLEGETERHRLIKSLRSLSPRNLEQPVFGENFTRLAITDACNACTTCARVCPTGALEFTRSEDYFQLTFSAAACVNCGLCLQFCEPQALERTGAPSIGELIDPNSVLLYSGTLTRCRKCNTPFAGKPDEKFCPICAFRRQNPLGSRWKPPKLAQDHEVLKSGE